MSAHISQADFAAALNQSFAVAAAGVDLTLESLTQDPNDQEEYECFSLLFRGAADPALDQGTVELNHEGLGAFKLFIVPIAQEDAGRVYQAVFNRKKSA